MLIVYINKGPPPASNDGGPATDSDLQPFLSSFQFHPKQHNIALTSKRHRKGRIDIFVRTFVRPT